MKGIFVGYDQEGNALSYKNAGQSRGEGHLFLSAPPRSGKARDILIPALLQYDQGSCIVIDPKGQLAAVTGPQRARLGQQVIILNPFHILPDVLSPDSPEHFGRLNATDKGRCTFDAKFNPMKALDPTAETFGADCDNIADGIVTHDGDRDSHWSQSAHGLISALIGHLAANMPSEKSKTLATVRQIIRVPERLEEAAQLAHDGEDGLVGEALEAYRNLKDAPNKAEIAGIISTARTQTRFMGNRAIADSLSGSDFQFSTLKKTLTTVFLVLPVRYMASCGKWFRLVLAAALDQLLTENKGLPVLCVLDEFAQLGKLGIIENCLGLAAGMGVQLWPVLQDLTQIKELYPQRWESFLGCAGVQMFFTPRENTSANYISELCGETTVEVSSRSQSTSLVPGIFSNTATGINEGTSTNLHGRRALLPQEIRQLPDSEFIMFTDGMPGRFIRAARKPYWEIPECRSLAAPDPYHKSSAPVAAIPAPDSVPTGAPSSLSFLGLLIQDGYPPPRPLATAKEPPAEGREGRIFG